MSVPKSPDSGHAVEETVTETTSGDELVTGDDWPTYFTQVPVWILLSGIPAQSYRLYAFLAEHINSADRVRVAWPKQAYMAAALSLSNPRQVGRYVNELVAIGALRVEEFRYGGGMLRSYRYHVRFNPPAGYAGYRSLAEFYVPVKAADKLRKEAEQLKRQAKKDAARQAGGTENSTTGGAENSTTRGIENSTAQLDQALNPDPVEPDQPQPALRSSARSAADVPEGPHPGNARAGASGSAAPENPDAAPLDPRATLRALRLVEADPRAMQRARRLLDAILPPRLLVAIERAPRALTAEVALALSDRTDVQLAARIERRWNARGYASADSIDRPIGVAFALIRPGDCPDPSCEDGAEIDTGYPCRCCAARDGERRRRTPTPAALPGAPGDTVADDGDADAPEPPPWFGDAPRSSERAVARRALLDFIGTENVA